MSETNSVSLVVIGIACGIAGLAAQRSLDAPLVGTGDQLKKLSIVGVCPIEKGDAPFANCRAQRLTGVVK